MWDYDPLAQLVPLKRAVRGDGLFLVIERVEADAPTQLLPHDCALPEPRQDEWGSGAGGGAKRSTISWLAASRAAASRTKSPTAD